jgi:hypothetical protein
MWGGRVVVVVVVLVYGCGGGVWLIVGRNSCFSPLQISTRPTTVFFYFPTHVYSAVSTVSVLKESKFNSLTLEILYF